MTALDQANRHKIPPNCRFLPLAGAEPKLETVRVDLREENVFIEFTSVFLESDNREINLSSYVYFDGGVWLSHSSPPNSLVRKGKIFFGRKAIELDVSDMADAWVQGDGIEARFVRLQKVVIESSDPIFLLDVCFVKGGASDYCAQWVIAEDASVRLRLQFLGDSLPDWVAEKKPSAPSADLDK